MPCRASCRSCPTAKNVKRWIRNEPERLQETYKWEFIVLGCCGSSFVVTGRHILSKVIASISRSSGDGLTSVFTVYSPVALTPLSDGQGLKPTYDSKSQYLRNSIKCPHMYVIQDLQNSATFWLRLHNLWQCKSLTLPNRYTQHVTVQRGIERVSFDLNNQVQKLRKRYDPVAHSRVHESKTSTRVY